MNEKTKSKLNAAAQTIAAGFVGQVRQRGVLEGETLFSETRKSLGKSCNACSIQAAFDMCPRTNGLKLTNVLKSKEQADYLTAMIVEALEPALEQYVAKELFADLGLDDRQETAGNPPSWMVELPKKAKTPPKQERVVESDFMLVTLM